jgi:serine phosphatase RsbU (regulator of sigma subunit)/Tfp pilus assembly protein PilF
MQSPRFYCPFFFLLLFAVLIPFSFSAQNKKKDSLLKVLSTQKDTARISNLLKIAAMHYRDTTNAAQNYLNEVHAIAKASGEKKYLGDYYLALGNFMQDHGDAPAAVEHYKRAHIMYRAGKYLPGQAKAVHSNALCHARNNKFRDAIALFKQSSELAEAAKDKKMHAQSVFYNAMCYQSLGEESNAIEIFNKALEAYKALNDSVMIGQTYNSLGQGYNGISDYPNAIANYISAQKIFQALDSKKDIAGCLINAAFVFEAMHNEDKALSNFIEGEKILMSIGNKDYLANVRHSIGTVLMNRGQYDEAIKKFNEAKDIFVELDNMDYYANAIASIGEIHYRKQDYDKAIPLIKEALKIKRELEEQDGICSISSTLGTIYRSMGNKKEAEKCYKEALELSKTIKAVDNEIASTRNLAELNDEMGNYKASSYYFERYSSLRDSIFKAESAGKIAEMEALYKTEKHAGEIALLNKQKEAQAHELKVKDMQRNTLLGGLFVLFVIAFLIYNRYRLKQRSNLELQTAYREIQQNRDEISIQKKEIMDSILYAKRIQDAILPMPGELGNHFTEHFVFYQPKDIISGDLYWFAKVKNTFVMAAVDCTGHGVPGAFMSVIGNDLLNHIIVDKNITDPAKVLMELDHGVHSSLAKGDSDKNMQDGMDLALAAINFDTNTLEFSGAHRPLIHVRNNEITELKPTKASIGGYLGDKKTFSNNNIKLEKGDCIYLFTDGFADQFGGDKGKKYKYKQLLNLIKTICNKSMVEQAAILKQTFEQWRGNLEQVDDICVIGVRV